jgi:hypothetical protein
MDFDGEIRATQLALHALDAGFGADDLHQKRIHLKNFRGAEFSTDAAPLAVPFDYLNSRTAHSRYSPLDDLTVMFRFESRGRILP